MSKIVCHILMSLILVGGAVFGFRYFLQDLKDFIRKAS